MKNWFEIVNEEKEEFEDARMTPSKFEDLLLRVGLLAKPNNMPGMLDVDKNNKAKNGVFVWDNPAADIVITTTKNPFQSSTKNQLGKVVLSGDRSRVREAWAIIRSSQVK